MDINGNIFVVTGGASGLGEACVRDLVAGGGKVSILDMNQERGEKLASELGGSALFLQLDVREEDKVTKAIEETMDKFGAIHGAINCAGLGFPARTLGKRGPISMDKFTYMVGINLTGTMQVASKAAAKMSENTPNDNGERGVIVHTASAAAYDGQIGHVSYSASKGGIVGLTLPMARDLAGYGIRVATIAPGSFDTPLLDVLPEQVMDSLVNMTVFPKRLGKPEEFSSLVLEIIRNSMLNGCTIRLDGAVRMPPG